MKEHNVINGRLTILIKISEYHFNNSVLKATIEMDVRNVFKQMIDTNEYAFAFYKTLWCVDDLNIKIEPVSPSMFHSFISGVSMMEMQKAITNLGKQVSSTIEKWMKMYESN